MRVKWVKSRKKIIPIAAIAFFFNRTSVHIRILFNFNLCGMLQFCYFCYKNITMFCNHLLSLHSSILKNAIFIYTHCEIFDFCEILLVYFSLIVACFLLYQRFTRFFQFFSLILYGTFYLFLGCLIPTAAIGPWHFRCNFLYLTILD